MARLVTRKPLQGGAGDTRQTMYQQLRTQIGGDQLQSDVSGAREPVYLKHSELTDLVLSDSHNHGSAGRVPKNSDLMIYAFKTHFWGSQLWQKC